MYIIVTRKNWQGSQLVKERVARTAIQSRICYSRVVVCEKNKLRAREIQFLTMNDISNKLNRRASELNNNQSDTDSIHLGSKYRNEKSAASRPSSSSSSGSEISEDIDLSFVHEENSGRTNGSNNSTEVRLNNLQAYHLTLTF